MKGTLRLFLTLCIAMLSMTLVQAQEKTYSGTVKSGDDGQVIIGANVMVDGTSKGTSTGADGKFTISTNVGDKLTFSYLGMKSQTVVAGATTTINITLQGDAESMDEVVVVAFGTSKKKDLTGSVSSIDSKVISSQSNSTVSRALEGAIPGVQIASINGQPGQDVTIQVRGQGTANAGQAGALIVIDGVPSNNPSVLATLNPKDIASMTISKDATSNSLYGARGANGVVIVTTKKGTQGKARVTFEGRWGINQVGPFKYDKIREPGEVYEDAWQLTYNAARYRNFKDANTSNVQNPNMSDVAAREFASRHLFNFRGTGIDESVASNFNAANGLGNWMLYNVPGAIYTPTGTSSTMNGAYLVGTDGKLNPNAELMYYDDWEDYFLQNRFRQEYNFTVSGGTETTDYFISAGYLSDPSYIRGSSFDRYNVRSNVNTQVTKWLKAGLNISYTRRNLVQAPTRYGNNAGSSAENPFLWINGYNPLMTIWERDKDGQFVMDANNEKKYDWGTGQTYSPLGATNRGGTTRNSAHFLEKDYWGKVTDDLTARGYVEATFLKDFKFTADLAMDNSYGYTKRYLNKDNGGAASMGGAIGHSDDNYLSINTTQKLSWVKSFGKHNVEALVGHEYYWQQNRSLNAKFYRSLISDFEGQGNFIGLNGGSTFPGIGSGLDKYALEGYFFRGLYNYDSKYYLSASVRTDGTSKFKDQSKRWGTFWSVGGAWRLSAESFMENASWLNDLKIRASYGTMGNQNGVGNYVGYSLWGLANTGTTDTPVIGINRGQIGNPNITWETTATTDVGIDFRMWDRFYGAIDYYHRLTTDMIWNRPVAISTGVATLMENSASMKNEGIELEFGVDIINTENVTWSFSANATHYRSKLVSIPEGVGSEALGGNFEQGTGKEFLRGPGKDFFNLYMYKYAGVDQSTGLAQYMHRVSTEDHAAGKFTADAIGSNVATTDYGIASKYEMGSATPDVIGGFSTSVRYKNFDLAATFAYQIGGKFFSNEYALNLYGKSNGVGGTVSKDWRNSWTPENTGAYFPIRMAGQSGYNNGTTVGSWMYTDMCLFSASYLSVKNLTIGYNLPQKLMDKWGIGGIRAYVSGDNLWMVTAKSGFDPRMNLIGGYDVGAYAYPQMRTWSLGINITF